MSPLKFPANTSAFARHLHAENCAIDSASRAWIARLHSRYRILILLPQKACGNSGKSHVAPSSRTLAKIKNTARRRKRAQRASDPATNSHDSATALALARRETKTAVANAEQADARLREALDILPQGIVFLDAEGRYILWNQQYADIYKRSADLFRPGAKLADTLRIGIARGDYPEAIGREDEWLAQRLSLLANPRGRHEQHLADGRWIMIEERRTSDGGVIGLRVDITEMKRREASFRLLFDGNPVPMFVCARDDRRHSRRQRCGDRSLRL
jgi:PAS domain-containing protein